MKAPHGAAPSPGQSTLPLSPETSYRPQDFIETPSNQLAFRTVMAWPDWPSAQLALIGPTGSGKTHLAQIWARHSQARALQAHSHLLEAIREDSTHQNFLLEGASHCDDTDLFHLLNLCRERNHALLVTADEAYQPKLADLLSRWRALPKARLLAPDDLLLQSALLKYFSDRQLKVPRTVLHYLMPRLPRTLSSVDSIVSKMDQLSLASKRNITIGIARKALEMKDSL